MDRARIAGPLVAFAFFATVSALHSPVHAKQGAAPPAESQSSQYFATVTADNVYVRSGPSVQSSYPFGKMDRGEVVRVVEESFGWARVQTAGLAFADITGFVPVDDRAQLSADGASITANAATELRAPNIGAESTLDSSWKQIGRIDAGATLLVVNRIDGERGSVWTVRLPEIGEGWINSNFLRRSTPAEAAAFDAPPVIDAVVVEGDGLADPTAQGITPAGDASGSPVGESASEPGGIVATAEIVPAKPSKSPEQIALERRRATFADLEATWLKVKGQPIADAELMALYTQYVLLCAESAGEPTLRARAESRIAQLEVQQEVQNKILELQTTRARIAGECAQINGVALAIEARSEYTAVGVLNASIVYDGARLPLLYRLQDPSTGQTVGYVTPGEGFQLPTMLGTLLGIKGERVFDDALKMDTITPKTIDFLTPRAPAPSGG
ncbi:MAG: SH3 domain-containing protein [Phycisphaerales bacterium]|nr:SH3 domain-containing protein [Phycisphaerales bacterium]